MKKKLKLGEKLMFGFAGLRPFIIITRRTLDWLESYFRDPGALVPATAHDGSHGPDFRTLNNEERAGLVAFLYGLKANPGSPNYPVPPVELDRGRP